MTTNVLACPDVSKNFFSGCLGEPGAPCQPGLTGKFCLSCVDATYFYSPSESTCKPCTFGVETETVVVVCVCVGAFLSWVVVVCVRCARRVVFGCRPIDPAQETELPDLMQDTRPKTTQQRHLITDNDAALTDTPPDIGGWLPRCRRAISGCAPARIISACLGVVAPLLPATLCKIKILFSFYQIVHEFEGADENDFVLATGDSRCSRWADGDDDESAEEC